MIDYFGVVEYYDGNLRVKVCETFRKYLARLFEATYRVRKLSAPSNKSHITIAWSKNSELPPIDKHLGKKVNFTLELKPFTNGFAIWLPVVSKEIHDIRNSLGLSPLFNDLHFCIGYLQ